MTDDVRFFARLSIEQVEEGHELAPRFDADGLLPCVTTAHGTGEVLMLGYMNAAALKKTILTWGIVRASTAPSPPATAPTSAR